MSSPLPSTVPVPSTSPASPASPSTPPGPSSSVVLPSSSANDPSSSIVSVSVSPTVSVTTPSTTLPPITPPTSPSTTPSTTPPTSPGGGTGAATITTSTTSTAFQTLPTSTSTRTTQIDSPPAKTSTTTSTIYSSSLLTESSTSTYETSSIVTSDGYVYTTQVSITTVLAPGTVVNTTTITTGSTSKSSSSNTGAIVGGVVGGIAALAVAGLLFYYLFNKKRRLKDEFDGNFDPLAVAHTNKHSPHPSLGGAAVGAGIGAGAINAVGQHDDDGMGGRIARGADGGGVISPYPFASPPNQPLPLNHQGPQMSQHHALGAAGIVGAYGNNNLEPHQHQQQSPQRQGHQRNPSNLSNTSSGNYPASVGTNATGIPVGGYFAVPGRTSYETQASGGPAYNHQGQQLQPGQYFPQQGQLQPPLSPTNTSSSGAGYLNYNPGQPFNPYAPPIGRGPSPGPSVGVSDTMSQSQYSTSSAAGGGGSGGIGGVIGGRNAKEMEAFGGRTGGMGMPMAHVFNPDEGHGGFSGLSTDATAVIGGSSAGDLASGPGNMTTTGKHGMVTLAPAPSISSRPPVQHQDAGRVDVPVQQGHGNEIPPAYDSLPQDVRR